MNVSGRSGANRRSCPKAVTPETAKATVTTITSSVRMEGSVGCRASASRFAHVAVAQVAAGRAVLEVVLLHACESVTEIRALLQPVEAHVVAAEDRRLHRSVGGP